MKVLVVGFGSIGSRHVQSLLSDKNNFQVTLLEPSDQSFADGLKRISSAASDVVRLKNLADLQVAYDFAIVATSSSPRFDILKKLLSHGLKQILVEKIVLQSLTQFDEVIALIEENKAQVFCNFPNRYFKNYIALKKQIGMRTSPLSMTSTAGHVGIGSGAIHYMDLFEYLTEARIERCVTRLQKHDESNKRGAEYQEFSGLMRCHNTKGDELVIYFDGSHTGGSTMMYQWQDHFHLFSERDAKEFKIQDDKIDLEPFSFAPQSQLSAQMLNDVVAGRSLLPHLAETCHTHEILFREVAATLGENFNADYKCLIT